MSEESQASSSAGKATTSAPPGASERGSGLEDDLIPQRYRRKPITAQEMEYIEVRLYHFKQPFLMCDSLYHCISRMLTSVGTISAGCIQRGGPE